MATWRDSWLQGSFRGVPFLFTSHNSSLGRRTQLHEYPGRDDPYVEDLGLKAGVWNLNVFVIGANYNTARDALIAAFNKAGPGDFIHPYLGMKLAVVTNSELMESSDGLGMARFSVTFTQSSQPKYPSAAADTQAAVASSAAIAQTAAADSFGSRVSAYLTQATSYVSLASGILSGGLVSSLMVWANQYLPVGQILGSVAQLNQAASGLKSFLADPAAFGGGITSLFASFGPLATSIFDPSAATSGLPQPSGYGAAWVATPAYSASSSNSKSAYVASTIATQDALQTQATLAIQTFGTWGATLTPSNPTALQTIQTACGNQTDLPLLIYSVQQSVLGGVGVIIPSISLYVGPGMSVTEPTALLIVIAAELATLARRASLIQEALATAKMSFYSASDAFAIRDPLAWRLEVEAEGADDAVCQALLDLRQQVQSDITVRSITLPTVTQYFNKITLPATVLAWQIYGDATMDADIVSRNGIANPGFVMGGQTLEVLTNAA